MAVDTRRIAETARLAASPIGRFALGPRRGRARRPLASSSKRRRHLAASFRNLELSFAPSPADRACAQLGARIEQPSSRSSTVSCRGLVIRAKGGDAILSAAGSARRAFAESRDGTRGLWPPPLVEKGLNLGRGAEEGAPIEYWRRASKRNRRGRGKNCWNCSKGCFAMAKVIRRVFSRDLMGIPRCKFRLLKNLAVNLTKLGKFLLARLKYYTFYLCTLSVSPTNDQFS